MRTVEILHNGCGTGDWYVIRINGDEYHSGHSISVHTFVNLLDELDVPIRMNFGLTDEEIQEIEG